MTATFKKITLGIDFYIKNWYNNLKYIVNDSIYKY